MKTISIESLSAVSILPYQMHYLNLNGNYLIDISSLGSLPCGNFFFLFCFVTNYRSQ